MSTLGPSKLKEVRAELILRGTPFNAFCREHGFVRQAVAFVLTGKRNGQRAQNLAERFLKAMRETS